MSQELIPRSFEVACKRGIERRRSHARRVEACLTIGPPRGNLRTIHGKWYWKHLGWLVYYSIHAPSKTMGLVFNHGLPVQQEVKLDRTEPNYGGIRWWFICPKCGRRVSRLYRPSYTHYFFCRHCYDLTYESVQSAGSWADKLFEKAAREINASKRVARLWVRLTHTNGQGIQEVKRPVIDKGRNRRSGVALRMTKLAQMKGLNI